MDQLRRCSWCNLKNPLYVEYHDREWCRPNFGEGYLYEMLILESFQAGLSWECVLNKREHFRRAFAGFDPEAVAAFDEEKVAALMCDEGIIRNRRKICAAIENSRIYCGIVREFGSFYGYLKTFAGEKTLCETGRTTNALSDAISGDLYKRGMRFVGSVIIYSYLQAIGMICSHEKACFLYEEG